MARLARVVVPGMPHHVTQRGNRRQQTFFRDDDYEAYLELKSWRRFLNSAATEEQINAFRQHERTGRPLGDDDLQKRLEKKLGRVLRRQKPAPKSPKRK